jgi:hypothetical protein
MIVAYFWTITPSRIPFALVAMGMDRFVLRRSRNVGFFKSLGTVSYTHLRAHET